MDISTKRILRLKTVRMWIYKHESKYLKKNSFSSALCSSKKLDMLELFSQLVLHVAQEEFEVFMWKRISWSLHTEGCFSSSKVNIGHPWAWTWTHHLYQYDIEIFNFQIKYQSKVNIYGLPIGLDMDTPSMYLLKKYNHWVRCPCIVYMLNLGIILNW